MIEPRAAEDVTEKWWIATDFFRLGGVKRLGPFESRDLALKVRDYVEKVENRDGAYCVDVEP